MDRRLEVLLGAKDQRWSLRAGPASLQIALATFGILALELALIRWTSSQIRIFAYFNNLVLIGAFLGMGLGVALGRRYPGLVHWVLPALLALALPLGFAEELGIVQLSFPDTAVSLWGADFAAAGFREYAASLSIFLGVFTLAASVFAFAGAAVGHLFAKLPALKAYTADLLGSLAGVAVFTLATGLHAGPTVWLLLGGAPFLWLSRTPLSALALAGVLALGWHSTGDAIYSAYNRIDVVDHAEEGRLLMVNRDFHQLMHDLSDAHLASPLLSPERRKQLRLFRDVYDLPFQLGVARGRALIVGAGTGNDAQAALRNGFHEVFSVDIDRAIIDLGRRLHPEHVYDDPRVVPVVNDARAFFEQYRGAPFDVVCYGLLDSHAMFSAMSSLRLDNYVYSEQGLRSAWTHVADQGVMTVSFSVFAGDWIADRLYWTLAKATGRAPIAIYHGMHYGATFIVAKGSLPLAAARLARYKPITPAPESTVRTVSDDWPFLYLRPGVFPTVYVLVLGAVAALAVLGALFAFGRRTLVAGFDLTLFFMGAGFLLIETRGVTGLSLLFGSTWLVNSAVFASILTVVILANLAVERFGPRRVEPWFAALLACVLLLWAFDFSGLNQYPLAMRGLLGGFVTALPVGVAGVIVSILLRRHPNPPAALGSNLLGAVIGGCLEYLSMWLGLRAVALLALLLYATAFLALPRARGEKP